MKSIAEAFGDALDKDDFERCKVLLSVDCVYQIGEDKLEGPEAIAGSYESNMIAGRKKLDELRWGRSYVNALPSGAFEVNFTDYLTHKGISHVHRCKQRLEISKNLIVSIHHIHNVDEHSALQQFYKKVGLPYQS